MYFEWCTTSICNMHLFTCLLIICSFACCLFDNVYGSMVHARLNFVNAFEWTKHQTRNGENKNKQMEKRKGKTNFVHDWMEKETGFFFFESKNNDFFYVCRFFRTVYNNKRKKNRKTFAESTMCNVQCAQWWSLGNTFLEFLLIIVLCIFAV